MESVVVNRSGRIRPARPHCAAGSVAGLAGTNDQQAAHVDAVGIECLERGYRHVLTVAADVPPHDYRRVRRTELEQQLTRSDDLLPPGSRGRVVYREHQISLSDSATPWRGVSRTGMLWSSACR